MGAEGGTPLAQPGGMVECHHPPWRHGVLPQEPTLFGLKKTPKAIQKVNKLHFASSKGGVNPHPLRHAQLMFVYYNRRLACMNNHGLILPPVLAYGYYATSYGIISNYMFSTCTMRLASEPPQ